MYSNYTPDRDRLQLHPVGTSLTQQNFQEECDINNIMRRFAKTGVLAHENTSTARYGNFTGFTDYHASMNKIIDAQNSFMSVDATIRARFHNDPGEFLEFTTNPENISEMIEMGLAHRSELPSDNPPAGDTPTPEKSPTSPEGAPTTD